MLVAGTERRCKDTPGSLDSFLQKDKPKPQRLDPGGANWKFQTRGQKCLSRQELEKGSLLIKLNPFLDKQNILRVGGRIKHSLMSYNERHPIILPKNSTLTAFIVKACYSRVLHGGVQQPWAFLDNNIGFQAGEPW